MLKYLVNWFIEHDDLATFVFESPAPNLRYSCYSDLFKDYATEIKNEVESGNAARNYQQAESRLEKDEKIVQDATEILVKMEQVLAKVRPWK